MTSKNNYGLLTKFAAIAVVALGTLIISPVWAKSHYNSFFNPPRDLSDRNGETQPKITIAEKVRKNSPKFSLLIKAAGLEETLAGEQFFTVLAPQDGAFDSLPTGILENLLQPENKAKLVKFIQSQIFQGIVSEEAMNSGSIKMLSGSVVKVFKNDTTEKPEVLLNDAHAVKVITPDNGVIIVVDKIVVPLDR